MAGLRRIASRELRSGTVLTFSEGSVLEFVGDAFVNAANEGCTGGFGIDEHTNKSGGFKLKEARKDLGGCQTGHAKTTAAFDHHNTRLIIHAVGPVYRINKLKDGVEPGSPEATALLAGKNELLTAAYVSSLREAESHEVETLAFCLLSAGVFRGEQTLDVIVGLAADAIAQAAYPSLSNCHLVAYTSEEAAALQALATQLGMS